MSNLPKHLFQMTEAELIRELAQLEPRVAEMFAQLKNGGLSSKELFVLNRCDIRARLIRAELDDRYDAACV